MKKTLKLLPLGLLAVLAACSTDSSRVASKDVAPKRAPEAGMADNWMSLNKPTVVAAAEPAPAPATKPAPQKVAAAPAAAPARTGSVVCSDPTGGIVPMSITMPREAVFGQDFTYEINVAPAQCAGNVIVTDVVPAGATFVRSDPPSELQGQRLRWNLGDMDKGQAATIKVTLRAEKEGNLVSCASISADPRTCSQIFIGKAALALTKTGPETAVIGAPINYVITVQNRGTLVAKNVVVVDEIPEGMAASVDQRKATLQIGDLQPNESKTVSVTLRGLKKGKFCNVAVASSANAGEAKAEACTTFLQPGLKIVKDGPKTQFLSRPARYNITVSNIGDTPLSNVTVTDTAPAGAAFAGTQQGATVTGNKAVFALGTLRAGEEKTVSVALNSSVAGNLCNNATVTSAEGLTETAQACTVWSGVGALLLETMDNPDPIQVGETTTYTVRVTNQGTADDTNIKVVVNFSAEIDPVSASNGGVVDGKTVTFPPFPRLSSKKAFEYTIIAKGAKIGDARTRFVRTSDGIPAPTTSEESTRVY